MKKGTMRNVWSLMAGLAVVLASAGAGWAGNLLTDGGFEGLEPMGTQSIGTYMGGHANGWYVLAGPTYLYWNFTPIADGQVPVLNGSSLQQAFSTTPGQAYSLSLTATSLEATDPTKHVTLWVDDGDIKGNAPSGGLATYDTGQVGASTPWTWPATRYSYEFTASGVWTTLTVKGFSRVAVDTFVVQPVPEPTSLALLAAGGLAVLRRRRSPEGVQGRK